MFSNRDSDCAVTLLSGIEPTQGHKRLTVVVILGLVGWKNDLHNDILPKRKLEVLTNTCCQVISGLQKH